MKLSVSAVGSTAATAAASVDRSDIYWVLGYLGWYFFYSIIYLIIFRVLSRTLYSISHVYQTIQMVFSTIDVLIMIAVTIVLKNKTAKICFGVFLLIRILLVFAYAF